MKLERYRLFLLKYKIFVKICPVGAELLHADGLIHLKKKSLIRVSRKLNFGLN